MCSGTSKVSAHVASCCSIAKYQLRDRMDKYRSGALFVELRLRREPIAGDDPPLPVV
jgi:hypothetical protein